jgi:proteic killer suppression protein
LRELFETGTSRRILPALKDRTLRRLDRIEAAASLSEIDIPGFDFHPLRGRPQRYSVHVNGPWCITFGWDGEDAIDVNLEQHH